MCGGRRRVLVARHSRPDSPAHRRRAPSMAAPRLSFYRPGNVLGSTERRASRRPLPNFDQCLEPDIERENCDRPSVLAAKVGRARCESRSCSRPSCWGLLGRSCRSVPGTANWSALGNVDQCRVTRASGCFSARSSFASMSGSSHRSTVLRRSPGEDRREQSFGGRN
jgi:hypothetical protein